MVRGAEILVSKLFLCSSVKKIAAKVGQVRAVVLERISAGVWL